jgi:hypothetical protein
MKPLAGETGPKNGRLANTLGLLAMVCVLLCALALALTSLFASARIGTDRYVLLQVQIFEENELTNLLIVFLGIVALIMLSRLHITKRTNRILLAAMLAILGSFGLFWAMSVNAYAESDGEVLLCIAEKMIAGDYTELATQGAYLHYYLIRYPYQCGLLSFIEVLVRLFGYTGALGMTRGLNVVLLVGSYAAIVSISERLFQNEKITFLTILLLASCVQPVFSCTFVYGLIPAFALCVWAIYFVILYLQTDRKRNIIPAVLLLALAAYVRSNTWIVIAAIAIVLLLRAIRKKSWQPLLFAVLIAGFAIPFPKIAQSSYEERIGTSFGDGYPKTYWIAMSLQEGWKATGWQVQAYQLEMESEYGEDMTAVDTRARADIRTGIRDLMQEPGALGTYLYEKLVSQWDEPTFTSIWITKSVGHYLEPAPVTKVVYGDAFDEIFRFAAGKMIKLLYFGFALGAVGLLKKRTEEQMILPLTILGGVLFHLIFEAKSQYVLEYLPLFAPLAAYGIIQTGKAAEKAGAKVLKRRKMDSEETSA